MATRKYCDGCESHLPRPHQVAIHGHRADGTVGSRPLPDAEFDWCTNCALIAFIAVKAANAKRANR